MRLFQILLISFILVPSPRAEMYELLPVESIIEIRGDTKIPRLQELIHTGNDRIELRKCLDVCVSAMGQIPKSNEDIMMTAFVGSSFRMRTYAIVKMKPEEQKFAELVVGYGCPTLPPIYIKVKWDEVKNDLTFSIIFKVNRPPPTLEQIVRYETKKVDRLMEADIDTIMSTLPDFHIISSYDTDGLSEEERGHVCKNAKHKISDAEGERIEIHYKEDRYPSSSKYYIVVSRELHEMEQLIMKAYECPTEPKIQIMVVQERGEYIAWALVLRSKFKRREITFTPDLIVETLGRSTSDPEIEELNYVHACSPPLYLSTRQKNEHSRKQQKEDPETKNRICTSITGSKWYRMFGYKPINIFEPSEQICSAYPDIFEKFPGSTPEYKPTNPTKNIYVHTFLHEEPVSESVFTCPCGWLRDDKDVKFEKHFVSEEYNMNYMSDSSSNHIGGRFIFKLSTDNRAYLYGIAEEPARALLMPDSTYKNVELLYLQRSSKHQPAEEMSDDPLCQLSNDQRSTVCSQIFHSKYYDAQLAFPQYNTCHKRRISFRNEDVRAMTNGDEYEEWMILCYVSFSLPMDTSTYFLSRAYNDSGPEALSANDVFVYQKELGEYHLQQSFTDVRRGADQSYGV